MITNIHSWSLGSTPNKSPARSGLFICSHSPSDLVAGNSISRWKARSFRTENSGDALVTSISSIQSIEPVFVRSNRSIRFSVPRSFAMSLFRSNFSSSIALMLPRNFPPFSSMFPRFSASRKIFQKKGKTNYPLTTNCLALL